MRKILASLLLFLAWGAGLALAEPADNPAERMTADEFLASLNFRQGEIVLADDVATLEVPDNFRYLGPEDTRRVLEEAWGNPSGADTLGMLFPADLTPLDPDSWAVVINYEEDGYVSDEEAGKIDYGELLTQMQEATRAVNEERRKRGYEPVELVGWAAAPHYDDAANKLYWAKELRFGDAPDHTLNYNIRILGRRGVLVLNAVAGMDQLAAVEKDVQQVLAFTEFNPGHRYADFDSSIDKVAAYGIAALIGGKIAAKVGLLAKLGVLLVAFKKFIVAIVVAVGAILARLFRRKKVVTDPPSPEAAGE